MSDFDPKGKNQREGKRNSKLVFFRIGTPLPFLAKSARNVENYEKWSSHIRVGV